MLGWMGIDIKNFTSRRSLAIRVVKFSRLYLYTTALIFGGPITKQMLNKAIEIFKFLENESSVNGDLDSFKIIRSTCPKVRKYLHDIASGWRSGC